MVLHSLAELGNYFGIERKERRPKVMHCNRCGCEMRRVGETNIYVCPGKDAKGKPCENRVIRRVFTPLTAQEIPIS